MLIRFKNLTKTFRDAQKNLCVINALDFTLPESGSAAIVGRSGVGKSTLLHMLGGLDRPSSGSVFYGDQDIFALNPDELSEFRGSNVGFVFQSHHLLGEFSALENAAMPLLIRGISRDKALAKAAEILKLVGLGDRAQHRPSELSGGEQQRVAVGRALVAEPKVILADEPTGNLDPQTASEVQELLLEMNRKLGNLLVVVTHSMELAKSLDRVFEMLPGGALREIGKGV